MLWLEIVSLRSFLVDGQCRTVCKVVTVDVLSDQPFNVSGVPWDMLLANLVVWASHPVLGKPTAISENDLVVLELLSCWTIEPFSLVHLFESLVKTRVLAHIFEDLPLDLPCRCSKPQALGRDVSCIPRHEVFLEFRLSCNLRHHYFYFCE